MQSNAETTFICSSSHRVLLSCGIRAELGMGVVFQAVRLMKIKKTAGRIRVSEKDSLEQHEYERTESKELKKVRKKIGVKR